MTNEELIAGLDEVLEKTRNDMARHVSVPIVLTIEGLGCRIVPAWVVESLQKVLRPTAELPSVDGAPK